jgi:hypothetical protein
MSLPPKKRIILVTASPCAIRVLAALAAHPESSFYGLEIYAMTGLRPGATYPILCRFESQGLVVVRTSRPRAGHKSTGLRHYQITHEGFAP